MATQGKAQVGVQPQALWSVACASVENSENKKTLRTRISKRFNSACNIVRNLARR
jgi:hypothetical protein